jgi:hypothetical protein
MPLPRLPLRRVHRRTWSPLESHTTCDSLIEWVQRPPPRALCVRLVAALAAWGFAALAASTAFAQLAPNQTQGFGNGRLVTFSYLQNFDCVDEPTLDLDFDGKPAQIDPKEMQTPICQAITEPTADPAGRDISHTAHLYVLVPMFGSDTNPADAMPCPDGGRPGELCGTELGNTLVSIFGFVPEAWRTTPAVATQCPDPNHAVPGTCTMHASSVDLSVLLAGLDRAPNPPTGPIFVPTPNHSHVVDNSRTNTGPIWWQVRPVLVMDPADWPSADGKQGITSSKAMDAAEEAGRAVEVGSNFFLFFSSKMSAMAHGMHH